MPPLLRHKQNITRFKNYLQGKITFINSDTSSLYFSLALCIVQTLDSNGMYIKQRGWQWLCENKLSHLLDMWVVTTLPLLLHYKPQHFLHLQQYGVVECNISQTRAKWEIWGGLNCSNSGLRQPTPLYWVTV